MWFENWQKLTNPFYKENKTIIKTKNDKWTFNFKFIWKTSIY